MLKSKGDGGSAVDIRIEAKINTCLMANKIAFLADIQGFEDLYFGRIKKYFKETRVGGYNPIDFHCSDDEIISLVSWGDDIYTFCVSFEGYRGIDIAYEIANNSPEKINNLILIDSILDWCYQTRRLRWGWIFYKDIFYFKFNDENELKKIVEDLTKIFDENELADLIKIIKNIGGENIIKSIETIKNNTLRDDSVGKLKYLKGKHIPMYYLYSTGEAKIYGEVKLKDVAQIQRLHDDSIVGSHFITLKDPELVYNAIKGILSKAEKASK